jgi:hypothetical protein
MFKIDTNSPPEDNDIVTFLKGIDFVLPKGFMEFFKVSNGANVNSEMSYVSFWPLTDMIQLNKEYQVDEYAPKFFIIGSDGGDTAYAIEKTTGYIFEMPFIGMSNDEAVFKFKGLDDFLEYIKLGSSSK